MQKILSLPNLIVLLLVVVAALFLFNAAAGDSAIFDEAAHIVSGYTYLKHLDYRFNPEHPPVVKILAGLPLLFEKLNFAIDKEYWTGINEQWWAGNEFLYKSSNDADRIIFLARVAPILLTLLLLFFTYFSAKELIGRWWALLPTFLLAFSPIVLAHGHYVTTDIGATLGMLLAIHYFLQFLSNLSRKNLIIAGLTFGLAQAIKFSAVLLIPYFFFLAIIFYLVKNATPLHRYFWNTILVMAIGYIAIVYPLYLLTTRNYPIEKQVSDTTAIIQNFRIQPLAALNIWMANNKILRPFAEYLFGVLMVLQRSAGGNNAFFLGELSSQGWWYYFPLIYLMKEPLPILLLVLIGIKLGLWRTITSFRLKSARERLIGYLTVHFPEFSMMTFVAFYWLTSITSPLNIGVRHIIPTLPFIYILSAGSIRKWFAVQPLAITTTILEKIENLLHTIFNFWIKTFLLGFLIIWLIVETTLAAPYFLSYFNEVFGGRLNGFYYVTDSNFDWGQDLKRLQKWVKENLDTNEKIAVDYFGGSDVKYYLGDQAEPWWSARGSPKNEGITWLAISANTLQGALATPVSGFYKNPADEYRWLENPYQFTDRAGASIFLYKLR